MVFNGILKQKPFQFEVKTVDPRNNSLLPLQISGYVIASATETVDSGSTPGRVKPKTLKIAIYRNQNFPAWRSVLKGTE